MLILRRNNVHCGPRKESARKAKFGWRYTVQEAATYVKVNPKLGADHKKFSEGGGGGVRKKLCILFFTGGNCLKDYYFHLQIFFFRQPFFSNCFCFGNFHPIRVHSLLFWQFQKLATRWMFNQIKLKLEAINLLENLQNGMTHSCMHVYIYFRLVSTRSSGRHP